MALANELATKEMLRQRAMDDHESEPVVEAVRKGSLRCSRCGKQHQKTDRCAAWGASCRKYQKVGHFAICCREKFFSVRKVYKNSVSNLGPARNHNRATVQVKMNGLIMEFNYDTGAQVTVIGKDKWN